MYKTVFTYEVISKEPLDDSHDLADIQKGVVEGTMIGFYIYIEEFTFEPEDLLEYLTSKDLQGSYAEFIRNTSDQEESSHA